IAHEVTQTEHLRLSADGVRHLIARQLIPNGIIPTYDGKVLAPPRAARSVLAIARIKTLDPKSLAGITRILQILLWPPLLIVLIAASALAQAWLYLVHGVGATLHDAFY